MIIRFFAHGDGDGGSAVGYLIAAEVNAFDADRRPLPGQRVRRAVLPEVLGGEPERTRQLIDSSPRKWRYTSGVIAFAASDVPSDTEQAEVRAGFEEAAFAGLEEDQRDILWVRHTHAGNVELHFLIPRTELHQGRAFNPAPPGSERYFNAFRDYWNARKGWADPRDPARRRDLRPVIEKGERAEVKAVIKSFVLDEIKAGTIRSHHDVLTALAGLGRYGLEIKPQSDRQRERRERQLAAGKVSRPATRITLRRVGAKDSREVYRFEDRIFHEDWTAEEYFGTGAHADGSAPAGGASRSREEVAALRQNLSSVIERRAVSNRERYGRRIRDMEETVEVPGPDKAGDTASRGLQTSPRMDQSEGDLLHSPEGEGEGIVDAPEPGAASNSSEPPASAAPFVQKRNAVESVGVASARIPIQLEALINEQPDPFGARIAEVRRGVGEHIEGRRSRLDRLGTLARLCGRRSAALRERFADLLGRAIEQAGAGAAALAVRVQGAVPETVSRSGSDRPRRGKGLSP